MVELMPGIEPDEVIVLLIILAGYIPVIVSYTRSKGTRWLFLGYTALLVGAAATVIEGRIYPATLNYIEHIVGVMGAGILFLVCTYLSHEKMATLKEEIKRKAKRGGA
jgi:hypothetical protein